MELNVVDPNARDLSVALGISTSRVGKLTSLVAIAIVGNLPLPTVLKHSIAQCDTVEEVVFVVRTITKTLSNPEAMLWASLAKLSKETLGTNWEDIFTKAAGKVREEKVTTPEPEHVKVVLRDTYRDGGTKRYEDRAGREYYVPGGVHPCKGRIFAQYPAFDTKPKELNVTLEIVDKF